MTTKLREGIVRLSQDERKTNSILRLALILNIVIFSLLFFEKWIIVKILSLLAFSLLFILRILDAIKKQNDEVIEKNKLLYIVLSEIDVVARIILYFITFPILVIISKFVEFDYFIGIIIVIVFIVGIIKLSNIITTHFKNKLSE